MKAFIVLVQDTTTGLVEPMAGGVYHNSTYAEKVAESMRKTHFMVAKYAVVEFEMPFNKIDME